MVLSRSALLAGGAAAAALALAPAPAAAITIAADKVTSVLSDKILGCHSDEGFMHQPQSFLSQMVYGEAFEVTNGMATGWTVAQDNGAAGSATLDYSQPFGAAKRPSMKVAYASGNGGAVRLVHRGMGNEGLVFQGGKPYEGYFWARATADTKVTVALNDYVSGAGTLASTVVLVPGNGAWTQLPYNLTPTGSTNCEGTTDPAVSCNDPFPDYVCVKCGGELSYGLANPGDTVWVGYARLEPGPWGRFAGLPVRLEGAQILQQMGVTAMRYGGSVGSSVNWKDFRGPVWNRTGLGRIWASSDMSGWGPFDAMDFAAAANISVAVTVTDSSSPQDLADMVEYCLGNASTPWGAVRHADGHPATYWPYAWEIGNEQYNNNFVAQVAAMEAKIAQIGLAGNAPPYYMFPDNGGLSPADQQAAVAAGLPIERIATDCHVGSAGAIEMIEGVFNKAPNFPAVAINGEVNAIYGDNPSGASAFARALSEASDLDDWFNAPAGVLSRIIARTASFCTERNGHDDGSQWHQGLSFFLPNMTWLGPAGQLHAMVKATWADGALAVSGTQGAPVTASAQLDTATGKRLVVRLTNAKPGAVSVPLTITGFASQLNVKVTSLTGASPTATNPPWDPLAIAPVVGSTTLPSGGGTVTVPGYTVMALELTAA